MLAQTGEFLAFDRPARCGPSSCGRTSSSTTARR
jgi:hypothetical protein